MTSKFIWQIGEDWSITKVSKGNNKLFADAKATPVYAVLGNSQMLETDTVEMTCTINGQAYHKVLLHYAETNNHIIVDDEAVSGWEVVSNGEELQTETSTYDVMTISFDVKRFSSIDGTTLLKNQPTGQTTENVYASDSYTPMVESSDAEHLEDLIAELNSVKQDKYDTSLETESKTVVGAINELNDKSAQIDIDIEELIEGKQDKLTAGENITIDENNVISATGYVPDSEFSTTSTNAVENRVITNKVNEIDTNLANKVDKTKSDTNAFYSIDSEIDYENGAIDLNASGTTTRSSNPLFNQEVLINDLGVTIQSRSRQSGGLNPKSKILKVTPEKVSINDVKIPEALNSNSNSQEDTYSANYINNELQSVREEAEGKTASYTISYLTTGNEPFNSQNDSISLSLSGSIQDIEGNTIALSDLKKGDIIWIAETEVPDRWVASIASNVISFYKMETTKTDISSKVDKTSSAYKLYATDSLGQQTTVPYDTYVEGAIARRDEDGQITVPLTPTANGHSASKKYVDDSIATKQDALPSYVPSDTGKVLTVDNQNLVWDYTKDEFVTFTKTNSSGTFAVTSAEWVSAMNNDKAILRVTDSTDYYVLYKVKYDATTVYFQGDGKVAQFIKDGVNYSGTFESAFDNTPTQDSTNPVTSGGVYSALGNKQDTLTAGTGITISSNTISADTPSEISYLTTAPVADNTSGNLKLVVLSSEPATKYNGYMYFITEE